MIDPILERLDILPDATGDWHRVEAALRAVLGTIQHWDDPNCDHRDDPEWDYCVCGRGQLLAKISAALGVKR